MPELNLPTPGVTPGIGWASQLNAAITDINDEIEGRLSEAELSATFGQVLTPIIGESATATTARINAVLAAGSVFGVRRSVTLVGDFVHNGPIVIPANTEFDTRAATLTLASGSLSNGIVNQAVQTSLRMMNAEITSGSTALTGSGFTAAHVGKPVEVWYSDPAAAAGTLVHRSTIASVTNGTTAAMADAAPATGAKLYASVGVRDKNITLRLGRLIRQTGNYVSPANGWLSNHVRLRHLDGYSIDVADVQTLSGKYAVNIGDCTDGSVGRLFTSGTVSDVLHLNGPVSGLRVGEVVSEGSGDDIVSLTGGDFTTIHQMADCQGDITGVNVGYIRTAKSTHPSLHTRALLLLAGQNDDGTVQYKISKIKCGWIDSRLNAYPVWIGNDVQDHNTQNAGNGPHYQDITVEGGVNQIDGGTAPPSFLRVKDAVTNRLRVGGVRANGSPTDLWVESTSTVDGLDIIALPRNRVVVNGAVANRRDVNAEPNYGEQYDRSLETFNRLIAADNGVTLVSGTEYLTYFRARNDLSFSGVTLYVKTAQSSATLFRVAIYAVDGGGTLTPLQTSASSAGLLGTTGGRVAALSAAAEVKAGKVYALGLLWVGTGSPVLRGIQGWGSEFARGDVLAARVNGLSDLPAGSISVGSLSGIDGGAIYARFS